MIIAELFVSPGNVNEAKDIVPGREHPAKMTLDAMNVKVTTNGSDPHSEKYLGIMDQGIRITPSVGE